MSKTCCSVRCPQRRRQDCRVRCVALRTAHTTALCCLDRSGYNSRTISTSAFARIFRARAIFLANCTRHGMRFGCARKNAANFGRSVLCLAMSNRTCAGAGNASREQRNAIRSARARNEFRLHVRRGRARCARNFSSLVTGIDQRWHSKQIRHVNWQS
jgi:hypothetical protein